MPEGYWTVTLCAFAFETEKEAAAFREAIEDAFCKMPEAEDVGCSTTINYEPKEN